MAVKRKRTDATGNAKKKVKKAAPKKAVARRTIKDNKKPMKLSRKLSDAVRKVATNVHNKTFPEGIYHKNYVGHHDSVITTANSVDVFSSVQRRGGNTTPYTTVGMGITPFNGRKLMDACSVLYNGKAAGINYELATGNFGFSGFKANIKHASWSMNMINNTSVIYEFRLIKAKNRQNGNTDFYTDYSTAISSETWVGGVPLITAINMKPGMCTALAEKYTMETVDFQMLPGDRKKFFETWNGQLVGEELADGAATPAVTAYHRKYGTQWLLIVKPAMVSQTEASTCRVGRFTGSNLAGSSILFEFKETYVVQQPLETPEANEGDRRVLFNDYEGKGEEGVIFSSYNHLGEYQTNPVQP